MSEQLVTIATFGTVGEADVAREVLQEAGVACCLQDVTAVSMLWHLSNSMGGVKLAVLAADAPRAIVVLRDVVPSPLQRATFAACSQCGAPPQLGFEACWSCGAPLEPLSDTEAMPISDGAPDDDEVSATLEGDALAARAFRAAVLGAVLLPPLPAIYSGWILFRLALRNPQLSSSGKQKACAAFFINLLICAGAGLFLRALSR